MRRAMLALVVVLAACGGAGVGGSTPAPSSGVVEIDPDINAVAPAKVSAPQAQRWKQGKGDAPSAKGNVYVAVLVKIEAVEDADYSPYYAKIRDASGFEYDWHVIPRKEPSLGSGELAPGDSVQGWVTFEVPSASLKKLTLIYDSVFGEQIQIPLTVKK